MRIGSHASARTSRAKSDFREMRGIESTVIRAQAIAALPTHVWHGTRVYGLTCQARFGRGPHTMYLPAGYLWSLIDLRAFRCPYHN